MTALPFYVYAVFVAATFLAVWLFWKAANRSRLILFVIAAWMAVQGIIAYSGFYTNTGGIPPRFVLAVGPALLGIALLFATSKGRQFLDSLDNKLLTLLHVVRIPIEIVLFWLCTARLVAPQMTFEGLNFDIVSGITAPLAWYLLHRKANSRWVLAWNVICLALVINIVTISVLAAPVEFQRISFDQPNIGVMYFPFIWLPCCVVPLVLLAHFASIRQLMRRRNAGKGVAQSVLTQ